MRTVIAYGRLVVDRAREDEGMSNLVGDEFLAKPLTVSELNRLIKDNLECALPRVWVRGEIVDLRAPQSGHAYFTLKDRRSRISIVMFRSSLRRLRVMPKEGMEVVVRGRISVYEPRGSYQVIAVSLAEVGKGGLDAELKKLAAKLSAEGLFDEIHKKQLPYAPSNIAVVTSVTGAAVRDIVSTVRGRYPPAEISICPVIVQGGEAVETIIRALDLLNRLNKHDVIILSRGGGSAEDLAPFNDERTARAVFASQIPIISAVGHEMDVVLTDLAADVRGRTPTHAGQLVVPDIREVAEKLEERMISCSFSLKRHIDEARYRLELLRKSVSPMALVSRLDDVRIHLDELMENIINSLGRSLEAKRANCEAVGKRLDSLNPLAVLGRGYSVTLDAETGKAIMDSGPIQPGIRIVSRLARGRLVSTVSGSDNG